MTTCRAGSLSSAPNTCARSCTECLCLTLHLCIRSRPLGSAFSFLFPDGPSLSTNRFGDGQKPYKTIWFSAMLQFSLGMYMFFENPNKKLTSTCYIETSATYLSVHVVSMTSLMYGMHSTIRGER